VSQQTTADHISRRKVLFDLPGIDAVRVRPDLQYGDSDAHLMDVYYPPDPAAASLPAVVIVSGFPGAGFEKAIGCPFKEMGSTTSWSRLIAASGLIAVAYANREPTADILTLVQHLRDHADRLGIDPNRIGLWASSGHVPLALGLLMDSTLDGIKCAVLCYGYTLDLDGSTGIAQAAKAWGFVNPAAGRSIEDLRKDVPLFVARAGQDRFAPLNERLDAFVACAARANLPLTFVNHPAAPHAFDLFDDSATTRHIIREIMAFLRFNLLS